MLSDAPQVVGFIWRHPANRGRRFRVLKRACMFQLRARLRGQRSLATIGRQSQLWAELGFTSATRAVYANPPDWPEMLVWEREPLTARLFVDIGANVGLYSLFAAEHGAEVIAVEPGREAYQRLVENAALNKYAIKAVWAAASNLPGTIRVTQDRDSVNVISDQGELVPATTIDELLGEVSAAGVKIDVEGYERLVLEGAERALAAHRIGLLQLEWNSRCLEALGEDRDPVAALLTRHGYVLYRPDDTGTLKPVSAPEMGEDVFARPA
jgi:FkbM family methyltransferase